MLDQYVDIYWFFFINDLVLFLHMTEWFEFNVVFNDFTSWRARRPCSLIFALTCQNFLFVFHDQYAVWRRTISRSPSSMCCYPTYWDWKVSSRYQKFFCLDWMNFTNCTQELCSRNCIFSHSSLTNFPSQW